MSYDIYYLIGPDSTTYALLDHLGLERSLLVVDIITSKKVVAKDVNFRQLLSPIENVKIALIITPIGGQDITGYHQHTVYKAIC